MTARQGDKDETPSHTIISHILPLFVQLLQRVARRGKASYRRSPKAWSCSRGRRCTGAGTYRRPAVDGGTPYSSKLCCWHQYGGISRRDIFDGKISRRG